MTCAPRSFALPLSALTTGCGADEALDDLTTYTLGAIALEELPELLGVQAIVQSLVVVDVVDAAP